MFVGAVEMAASFTRPIHTIVRYYRSQDIVPATATLFFVNHKGWALTCAHVARQLAASQATNDEYRLFTQERDQLSAPNTRAVLRKLEKKHQLTRDRVVEIQHSFVNCVQGKLDLTIKTHPSEDVALLQFKNFDRLGVSQFPVFAATGGGVKQGKSLCRLGFPFPEFSNYAYDPSKDQIEWTQTGREDTPCFPIDGIVTRYVAGQNGSIVGFEMSTPGLRGQSGGPAFDTDGTVCGMQSATQHLDLDFDVDIGVVRAGKKKRVQESAILHVGRCVHIDILKTFMDDNGVSYQVA